MKIETIKPKLFWLIAAVVATSLVVGIPGVLIAIATGSQLVSRITFYLVVLLWAVGGVTTIAYWLRQLSGKYVGMERRSLRSQIW